MMNTRSSMNNIALRSHKCQTILAIAGGTAAAVTMILATLGAAPPVMTPAQPLTPPQQETTTKGQNEMTMTQTPPQAQPVLMPAIAAPLKVGDTAPRFALPSAPGEVVDVGALIGKEKIVLLFFPLAYSGVCTTEMCHMRDTWGQWSDLKCKVFAISIDSPFVEKKFREDLNIPYPVLSDMNRKVCAEYGALYPEFKGMMGIAKRSAFVIDSNGKIAYAWVSEDAGKQPDYEKVNQAVKNAK